MTDLLRDTIHRMRFPPQFTAMAIDDHRVIVSMSVENLPDRRGGDATTALTHLLILQGDEAPDEIARRIRERMQWLALHEIDEWTLLDYAHLNQPHDVWGNGEVKFTADDIRAWNAVKAVVRVFNYGART